MTRKPTTTAHGSARTPCPGVSFPAGFARRLESLVPRLALARERREGAGRPGLHGGGVELVGHRPYRPGDDLRDLDWSALARLDRPFVRVTAREAGERWLVSLDTSASMGVGPPGKLQRAAEVVAGIAALGIRLRAEVRITVTGGAVESGATPREVRVQKRADLPVLLAFLESLRAEGGAGHAGPVAPDRSFAEAARVFLIGDLRGTRPEEVLAPLGRRRDLCVIQILAPVEIAPPDLGLVEWRDPEQGARLALSVDAESRAAYAAELEGELERWREACARHRVRHGCFSSALEFEDILERSLFG